MTSDHHRCHDKIQRLAAPRRKAKLRTLIALSWTTAHAFAIGFVDKRYRLRHGRFAKHLLNPRFSPTSYIIAQTEKSQKNVRFMLALVEPFTLQRHAVITLRQSRRHPDIPSRRCLPQTIPSFWSAATVSSSLEVMS